MNDFIVHFVIYSDFFPQQFGYAFKHLYAFVNLCEESVPTETIIEAITKGCSQ